mmetsp:Transcript_11525/g.19997  ORF Transcript_11525/g.19997 Transcript_11525/m.19997 type:complete len:125 (+) Transcript_11525:405-779(+)
MERILKKGGIARKTQKTPKMPRKLKDEQDQPKVKQEKKNADIPSLCKPAVAKLQQVDSAVSFENCKLQMRRGAISGTLNLGRQGRASTLHYWVTVPMNIANTSTSWQLLPSIDRRRLTSAWRGA